MSKPITIIQLTAEEIKYLEDLLSKRSTTRNKYNRCKILLMKAKGETYEAISSELGTTIRAAVLCVKKYNDGGIEYALNDRKRGGHRVDKIPDDDVAWIVGMFHENPKDYGYSVDSWYSALFTRFIRSKAIESGHPRLETVSQTSIRRILEKSNGIIFNTTYFGLRHSDSNRPPCTFTENGTDCHVDAITKLERYRMKRGMTSRELADLSGVNLQTINRLERSGDIGNIAARTLIRISDALCIDPKSLL